MEVFSDVFAGQGYQTLHTANRPMSAFSGFGSPEPRNLEKQAIHLVGTDLYVRLIKGYTEKQCGRECTELPAFIIKRLPCRYTYDNNYFNDRWQGIPIGGYTRMVKKCCRASTFARKQIIST